MSAAPRTCGAALAVAALLVACTMPRAGGTAAERTPRPAAPAEVNVQVERDGLAALLREHYLGAWLAVRPSGQFVKNVYRVELPVGEHHSFLCRVGDDFIGVCPPPPSREMRTYPLDQVQFSFNDFCGDTGRCAKPR